MLNITQYISIVAWSYRDTPAVTTEGAIVGQSYTPLLGRQYNFGHTLWTANARERISFDYFSQDSRDNQGNSDPFKPYATNHVWWAVGMVFSYGDSNAIKYFCNGQVFTNYWYLGNPAYRGGNTPPTNSTSEIYVGANAFSGGGSVQGQWIGELSEIAIWNTILADAQMKMLTSAKVKRLPLQIKPGNLAAYWPLDNVASGISVTNTSTNIFRNLARNQSHCTTVGGYGYAPGRSEHQLSYPPNE